MTLANKYRPKSWDDVTEQKIIIDILKNMCSQPELTNRNFLFVGPAGTGKAQPLYSKILTPNGFVHMGDIEVGDVVYTDKGNVGKVSEIYPQGIRPIYEITLQDRTKIRVADNHLNCVWRYNQSRKCREDFVVTTTDLIPMFERGKQTHQPLRIDIPSIDMNFQEVPIDPYLLGALIGDGSFNDNFSFSNPESDVVQKVDAILRRDWDCKLQKHLNSSYEYSIVSLYKSKYIFTYGGSEYDSSVRLNDQLSIEGYPRFDVGTLIRLALGTASNTLKKYPELANKITYIECPQYEGRKKLASTLESLGLLCKSVDKHIPSVYLINSKDVRYRLLQGLFDTDGCVSAKNGGVSLEFSTTSSRLSEDFAFLVRSLGIRDTVISRQSKYTHNGEAKILNKVNYRHFLKSDDETQICSSTKHRTKLVNHQNKTMRNIVSIDYVGDEECQCIMVDHLDHTYISDGFIPTHNTTTARILANELNGNTNSIIEIDAASNNSIDNVRRIVEEARAYPIGSQYKIFILDECHTFSSQSWQVLLKTFEEQPASSIFCLCTTNPEKIPETILSRVQIFKMAKISLDGIIARLKYVLESEISEGSEITYTDEAIAFISKISNGGMRQALTNLDRVLAYSKTITMETTESALNLPNYDVFFEMLNACVKHDNENISRIVNDVYNSGVNFVNWFEQFQSFVINILKFVYIQDINSTNIPNTYLDKLQKYEIKHATLCLKLATVLMKMISELRTTTYLQEIALVYLCGVKQ